MSTQGSVGGVIKWFNIQKGYGWVKRDDGQRDVFVHAKQLEKSRYPGFEVGIPKEERIAPETGDKVFFDVENGDRGPFAVNISPG